MSAPVHTSADAVLDELAARLADPAALRAHAPAERASVLLSGRAGVTLLFAELGHADPAYRRIAHRHLAAAAGELRADDPPGLFLGSTALAFLARCAAHRAADYGALLTRLDGAVRALAGAGVAADRERLAAGLPASHAAVLDVLFGLTGLGRYLLRALPANPELAEPLRAVLTHLVARCAPVRWAGAAVPGLWSVDQALPAGYLSLGLAHGVPGPLALLALAWGEGVRVPGQRDAMETLAGILAEFAATDDAGPYWPFLVPFADYRQRAARPEPARAAWCYGTPGIARALQLAGHALDRPDCTALAADAVRALLRRPAADWRVTEPGLCHGWAGLLHQFGRIAADDPDAVDADTLDKLAERTIAEFRAGERYGYLLPEHATPRADPGFLLGAAGIALALHAYRTGAAPVTGWDAALLLS